MKKSITRLSFDLPEDLKERFGSEAKSERALNQDFVAYKPKHPELMSVLAGNALEEGYKRMGRINLGMAEMGFEGDVCCLQNYEDNLRDDADDTEY